MLSSANDVDHTESIDAILASDSMVQLAGDWSAYSSRIAHAGLLPDIDTRLSTRRQCALAYMGKRAQLAGGVYNSTSATVFTDAFTEVLGAENRQRRHRRYPWLAELLAITEALEREQHVNGSVTASVISFPARRTT